MNDTANKIHFSDYMLHKDILKALDLLGLNTPTPIQREVIPHVLQKHDCIAQAQTGSGKTASYAIPLCELVEWEENKPQVMILTPTRELAMQVQQEITDIGKLKRIKAPALYGKQSFKGQEKDLKQKSHMVVGTPGRVLDHLERGTLFTGCIGYLVIDEADEMFHMGFIEQVEQILSYLPNDRVTLLFSATMPKEVVRLAEQYMHNPVQITIEGEQLSSRNITHSYYSCDGMHTDERIDLLKNILKVHNPDSCIIFANMRSEVEDIYDALWDDGFSCGRLHGGMEQWERTEVMRDFKKGLFRYLVATDVAARWIDVENISLVVNYELPHERETYIHRIGRTGRAGQNGMAVSLLERYEQSELKALEKLLEQEIAELSLPDETAMEQVEAAFRAKMDEEPEVKGNRNAALKEQILKLQIDDGKKAKIRPVDIVGTICAIPGLEAKDIGVIQILDWTSTVEILNGKGQIVLDTLQTKPIKAKVRKVRVAKEK
ncbi:MAG: DEAD/DEAH box helicase [Peptococcaceae bacterium]|nr:DEAD/DEAH box helicase [Peptococcaceae bacterium]